MVSQSHIKENISRCGWNVSRKLWFAIIGFRNISFVGHSKVQASPIVMNASSATRNPLGIDICELDACARFQRIEREATFAYQTLTVPEDTAANVLHINGTLVHRSPAECPESCKVRVAGSQRSQQGGLMLKTTVDE
jgi:hypothetical protein